MVGPIKNVNTRRVGVALLWTAVSFSAYSADEIAAFRLTGAEGYVELRYRNNDQTTEVGDVTTSRESRIVTEQEIYVLTHSYIYHPSFLKVDLGLGPFFQQKKVDYGAGLIEEDESPWNMDARLHFLEEKPYPLNLYYIQNNSVTGESLQRFESKYTKQGVNFSLLKPVTPIPLHIEGFQARTKGGGFDYIINDATDVFTFRSTIPSGDHGNHQLDYTTREVISESGRTSLPIQKTALTADSARLDSRLFFGAQRQIQLINNIAYLDQKSTRSEEQLRITPNVTWQHSDKWRSQYSFNYLDDKQDQVTTQNRSGQGGFNYKMRQDLEFNADLHGNDTKITGSRLTSYGTAAAVNYSHTLPFGRVNLLAAARYDVNDRVVSEFVPVRGESHILIGTIPDQLARDNIVLTSIRVFEVLPGGTEQEQVVGIGSVCNPALFDILVTAIGAKTQITNCNGIAGVSVPFRVDYVFDPGGTVAYSTLTQNYQANLDLFQYYKFYAQFADSSNTIRSGAPTTPLDAYRNTLVGAQADYPLYDIVTLGADVRYEDQRGTRISYDRYTADIYTQFQIWSSSLKLSRYRVLQDYIGEIEDIDLVRHRLQFRTRIWDGFIISFELMDEEDTGGVAPRRSRFQNLIGEWRMRKLTLKGEAKFTQDRTGLSGQDHARVLISLRRDF